MALVSCRECGQHVSTEALSQVRMEICCDVFVSS